MRGSLFVLIALPVAAIVLSGDALALTDAGTDAADSGPIDPGPTSTADSIAAGVSAKESCSCVFVVHQSDAYCKAFGSPADYVTVNVQIDRAGMGVTSRFLEATRTAHYVEGNGCTLDP